MQQIAKRNNGDTETLLNFCGRKWKGLQFTRGVSLKLLKSELPKETRPQKKGWKIPHLGGGQH